MTFEEREHRGDSPIGSTVNKLHLLVDSKGPQAFARVWEVGERFGAFGIKKSIEFSRKFIELPTEYGIPPTIMLSAGHIGDPQYKALPEYYREAQKHGVTFGSHGWNHEAHLQLSEKAQEEVVLGSKNVLERCDIHPSGWRAPRYQNGRGTEMGITESGYLWDATPTRFLWPKAFDTLTPEQRTNLARSRAISNPPDISKHLALPEIQESYVELPTMRPDDEELNTRAKAKNQMVTDILCEMVAFAHDNMELLVQQFHPERINTYNNQLQACFEEIHRYGNVQLSTPDQMAAWWRERERVTLTLETRCSEHVVRVVGPERGRAILINPKERPSDQAHVYGRRQMTLPNSYYPGIGLRGTPENVQRVQKLLPDFLSEPYETNQNYAYVIHTVDSTSDPNLVTAIRDITSGNVAYPMVMRSRFIPKLTAPAEVYSWAYLLIGDICQFNVKNAVVDFMLQQHEIERARANAQKGLQSEVSL